MGQDWTGWNVVSAEQQLQANVNETVRRGAEEAVSMINEERGEERREK